jgi:hypothetical protein
MLVGIDPFNDDDPMMIYQKIIKGKVKFPKTIEKYINYNYKGSEKFDQASFDSRRN